MRLFHMSKKYWVWKKLGTVVLFYPGTTGLLPIGLEEGTKIVPVLLLGPKEYIVFS